MVFGHKKGFDTVDHEIFLGKLSHYEDMNIELVWFLSYLRDRRQCCKVNGIISNLEIKAYGVPQGSCLGPLISSFISMIQSAQR